MATALLRYLADQDQAVRLADLPGSLIDTDTLTVLDSDGLVEFGCRNHVFVGPDSELQIESGWSFGSCTRPGGRSRIQRVIDSSRADVDQPIELQTHIRLTDQGQIEAARLAIVSKQDQAQPDEVEAATPSTPKAYLWNWTEILDAVKMPDTEENRRQVRRLSDIHNGPITVPVSGGRPVADRTKLIEWWNGLESWFQQLQQQRQDQQATVADQYNYGRTGVVIPGIDGSEKKRRSTKKK